MPSGLCYLILWSGHFPTEGISVFFSLFFYYHVLEISVSNANSVDPDRTPRSAASDLGLHCLQMPLFYGTLGRNGLRM